MVKLDIYGGLLGSGKTTLIKQMLKTAYAGSKTAIIENEIGKINLDAEMLKETGISVREISSGCICCTLKGNFTEAVKILVEQEHPDYIVVEPSGVADLSDVASACMDSANVVLNRVVMVVNAKKLQRLLELTGPFFPKQIRSAWSVYLNFADEMSLEQVKDVKKTLWEINGQLAMVDTPLPDINRETFAEGIGDGKSFGGKNILDIPSLPTSLEKPSVVRLHSARDRNANSWCYEFDKAFDDESVEALLKILQQEECADIWRVKGYLKMCDGKIKKIDVSFGDQFLEELESFPESKTNCLVVIGKRVNFLWLKKQFEQLQQYNN